MCKQQQRACTTGACSARPLTRRQHSQVLVAVGVPPNLQDSQARPAGKQILVQHNCLAHVPLPAAAAPKRAAATGGPTAAAAGAAAGATVGNCGWWPYRRAAVGEVYHHHPADLRVLQCGSSHSGIGAGPVEHKVRGGQLQRRARSDGAQAEWRRGRRFAGGWRSGLQQGIA